MGVRPVLQARRLRRRHDEPVHDAPSGAPVFDEALAWMDREVRHSVDLGTHTMFVGEIMAAQIKHDEARPATTQDTRMKYGGVKRH